MSRLLGIGVALGLAAIAGLTASIVPSAASPDATEAATVTRATWSGLVPLSDRRVVTGWVPYWDLEEGLASVLDHPDLFADVSPFWYRATKASQVRPMEENWRDESELISAIDQLHANGIAAYPTIKDDGFDGPDMAELLGSRSARNELVSNMVDMVLRTGADGVDVDFEGMNFKGTAHERNSIKRLYPVFLERLQAKLHVQDKVLSIALPPRRSARDDNWEVIDYDAIGKVVDRARVMTYDYSTDRPGPISPIGWTRDVIEYAQRQFRGVPLSIGVPAYGSNWYVKTLRGSCPADVKRTVQPTSTQALALADDYDADLRWSKEAGEYHYDYRRPYDEYGRCVALRRVWFGEARSTEARAQLAKRLGVQGIAVFSFGIEDPRMWPRVRDVASSINPDRAKVTISAPGSAAAGEVITISGRVTVKGVPVGATWVTLQRRVPGRSWVDVDDLVTDAEGRVSSTATINRTLQWRIKLPADWDWRTSFSEDVRVVVAD